MHPLAILVVWTFLDFGRPKVEKKILKIFRKNSKSFYFYPGNPGLLKLRQKGQMVFLGGKPARGGL